MGQDLTYSVGEAEFSYRISRADWELIQALQEFLPHEAGLLFVVEELGDTIEIPTPELREAAGRLSEFMVANPQLLLYTYQFKTERSQDPRMTPGGFSTGGMSGLRLPGDTEHYYSIDAGLNECHLDKIGVRPDGKGFLVNRRDLRGERELLTETVGKISIRRTRARSELRRGLAEIIQFLKGISSQTVIKSVG